MLLKPGSALPTLTLGGGGRQLPADYGPAGLAEGGGDQAWQEKVPVAKSEDPSLIFTTHRGRQRPKSSGPKECCACAPTYQ